MSVALELTTLVILHHLGNHTNVRGLLGLIIDTALGLAIIFGLISFYEPLPPDLFYWGFSDPFSLQEGWLLWAIIGFIVTRAATTATMWTTDYLSLKMRGAKRPRRRREMRKAKTIKRNDSQRRQEVVGPLNVRLYLQIGLSLLAPLVEEYTYRGFLLASLTKWLATPIAVVISSVVFAVIHRDLRRLPHIFVSGLVLGLIYAQTRNLITSMTMHALWNFVECGNLVRPLTGNVFEDTGYGNWRRSMLSALSAKNKTGFIDGSIPKPAANSAASKYWQRCDDIVFSWILNSLSTEIGDSVLYSSSAEVAWKELKARFGQSNGAQLYGVQKKLNDFAQGNDSIVTYFTKIKSVWDEIEGMGVNPRYSCNCTCGATEKQIKFQEDRKVVQFLMGLNDSFSVIRRTILMQNPLPKMAMVYNILLQEVRQRELHNPSQIQVDAAAMLAILRFSYNKGFQGHSQNYNKAQNDNFNQSYKGSTQNFSQNQGNGNSFGYQPNNNYKSKNPMQSFGNQSQSQAQSSGDKPPVKFCNYCKRNGHTVDSCWHLQNRNRRFAGNDFFDQDINQAGGSNGNMQCFNTQSGVPGDGNMQFLHNDIPSTSDSDHEMALASANFAGRTCRAVISEQ